MKGKNFMPYNLTVTGKNSATISTPEGDAFRQIQSTAINTPLDNLTLPQALAWIDANVTDLSTTRDALKYLVRLIYLQQAEMARKR